MRIEGGGNKEILYVTLVGRCAPTPPTRSDLLHALRGCSPRCYHATSSYIWTEDNFFTSLRPYQTHPATALGAANPFYAFVADMSCGGNEEDVRVVVMILHDLTVAVKDLVAVVTEGSGVAVNSKEENGERSDVLLVELADTIEESEEAREAFLRRWGADEHDYHQSMVGRVLMTAGAIYVAPLHMEKSIATRVTQVVDGCKRRVSVPLTLLEMDSSERESLREPTMTEALHRRLGDTFRLMREESWHRAIVAVPMLVAEIVYKQPCLVQDALLHYVVRHPLQWLRNGKMLPTFSPTVEDLVSTVVQEYRMMLQNLRHVRIPLHMPRYVFAHLFCAPVPPSVLAEPLERTIETARLSILTGKTQEVDVLLETNKEEVLLGLQLTIALQRLRKEMPYPHGRVIDDFLADVAGKEKEKEGDLRGAPLRYLRRLRRRLMPVPTTSAHSTEWMRAYAMEAAQTQLITDNELAGFDEYMCGAVDCESSSSETDKLAWSDGSDLCAFGFNSSMDNDCENAFRQLEEIEEPLETEVRDAVLAGSHNEELELERLAANPLLRETVQLLSADFVPSG
uniref:Uncharacterized protein n=1 Tax=Trypanosoma vivax (strain Y486) TaxID=1055687 RepID=G0TX13_TRYVY|nr:conserved hypothetical protein [Trypanosoma vivax Y486]